MSLGRLGGLARAVDVLRLLGRMEFLPSRWIHRLIYPDCTARTTRRALTAIHAQGLIWRAPADAGTVPGSVPYPGMPPLPQSPVLYGLTPQGRQLLADGGYESENVIRTFVVRQADKPHVKTQQLAHDLLVVDWCASVIMHACRHPQITGIRCQLEYVSAADSGGQAYQRFDALVCLRATTGHPRAAQIVPWQIPWYDGTLQSGSDIVVVRFAVELDRGTEKLATLYGKALTYAQLTRIGHYTATLGGNVLPVVIAPPGRRGAQIAREWRSGWPQGLGVVSSWLQAPHPRLGTLWGTYYTMTTDTAQQVQLLPAAGWSITQTAWEHATTTTRQGAVS